MRKILLLLLFVSFFVPSLIAQTTKDTINYLLITEARMDEIRWNYVEITNMSTTKSIDLSQFEFGMIDSWSNYWDHVTGRQMMLPKVTLLPGKSYVIAKIQDFAPKMAKIDPEHWKYSISTIENWLTMADMGIYAAESNTVYSQDSVTLVGNGVLDDWAGRAAWYLEQHFSDGDSVVVDAVNADRSNPYRPGQPAEVSRDCAGVVGATGNSVLIRKFSRKTGSTDWEKQRGVDLKDSEWMPVPLTLAKPWGPYEVKQPLYWTIGNHGDYKLTPQSFTSKTIEINYTDTTMKVPWGVRKGWKMMKEFNRDKATGVGNGFTWDYHNSLNRTDSAFVSARTGDVLTIYAAGNELQIWNFKLTVKEPLASDNIVISKNFINSDGSYGGNVFVVSEGIAGMDTISEVGFATRVDTLFKYLEKAPASSWQIVYKDGSDRPDLMNGDLLKVTAKNGSVKNYYIKVDKFLPNHDATLSAITWPDMPLTYKDVAPLDGWTGDTIPGFAPTVTLYNLKVPLEYDGVPALLGKTANLNAKVDVARAVNTTGTLAERTMIFNTTAEDDTTFAHYSVVLDKEKDPSNLQPYYGEPFFSQYVFKEQWKATTLVEIYNPGNQPLDLSKYMVVQLWTGTGADAVRAYSGTDQWGNRWCKYVPGYIWESESDWAVQPAKLVQDLNVNPIVAPGETFVFGPAADSWEYGMNHHWQSANIDVNFSKNPWGQTVPEYNNAAMKWINNMIYLLRIDNDSVINGLKPATDPNDFTVIDVMGKGAGSWYAGGKQLDQRSSITRKPYVQHGNPEPGASFGPQNGPQLEPYGTLTKGNFGVEWAWYTPDFYYAQNYGWADAELGISRGIGSHQMDPITFYKSTISSSVYKVSPGYSLKETIKGVKTQTTVNDFVGNINKEDPKQTLAFKNLSKVLGGNDALSNGDTLVVLSADSLNKTKYILSVTEKGLSTNAKLTALPSSNYYISEVWTTGNIWRIPVGTTIKTVLANVIVPAGATLTVIDKKDKYVPFQKLNYDTTYVNVQVTDNIFFEVVAEDGVTKIKYQLIPNVNASDAFVTSDVYTVDQKLGTIALVPRGTTVKSFFANLVPATGATLKLIDKKGYERTTGNVYQDDKLVVTSADGKTTKVYYLTMLLTRESTGEKVNYLAILMSDVYIVDQKNLTISGPSAETLLTDFNKKIYALFSATAVVVNAQGQVSTAKDLNRGDKVKVTAVDGFTVAYYTLQLDYTSVNIPGIEDLEVYPNPTSGKVNLNGLTPGYRIMVCNLLGTPVVDKIAGKSLEIISLENQPAGLYFVIVSNANKMEGVYKIVKQ
jgi:hypothetical protein